MRRRRVGYTLIALPFFLVGIVVPLFLNAAYIVVAEVIAGFIALVIYVGVRLLEEIPEKPGDNTASRSL